MNVQILTFRDDPRGPERNVPENESDNSDTEVG
jgi:hypothetical protein